MRGVSMMQFLAAVSCNFHVLEHSDLLSEAVRNGWVEMQPIITEAGEAEYLRLSEEMAMTNREQ